MDAVTITLGERSNSVQVQLYDKSRELLKYVRLSQTH